MFLGSRLSFLGYWGQPMWGAAGRKGSFSFTCAQIVPKWGAEQTLHFAHDGYFWQESEDISWSVKMRALQRRLLLSSGWFELSLSEPSDFWVVSWERWYLATNGDCFKKREMKAAIMSGPRESQCHFFLVPFLSEDYSPLRSWVEGSESTSWWSQRQAVWGYF